MASTPLTARLLEPADDAAVAALWAASDRLLPHRPELVRATCGPTAERWVGVLRGGDLLMAVAFREVSRRGLRRWQLPPFMPYAGPLVSREAAARDPERFRRECLTALARAVPSTLATAETVCPPGFDDVRGLVWAGWTAAPHYEYVSQWSASGEWEKAIESSVRRQIRKAREAGVVVTASPASDTGALAELWRATAKRQGLEAGLAENITRLGAALSALSCGFSVVARDAKGATLAAALIGFDGHAAYYLAGASGTESQGTGASSLVQAEALAEIDRRGLARRYEWVGANTPSVARFKRHFGPELAVRMLVRRESPATLVLRAARQAVRPSAVDEE